ncbi:hypothetical protein VUR80DRAFT_9568 [Thermomyces stellatus]
MLPPQQTRTGKVKTPVGILGRWFFLNFPAEQPKNKIPTHSPPWTKTQRPLERSDNLGREKEGLRQTGTKRERIKCALKHDTIKEPHTRTPPPKLPKHELYTSIALYLLPSRRPPLGLFTSLCSPPGFRFLVSPFLVSLSISIFRCPLSRCLSRVSYPVFVSPCHIYVYAKTRNRK